MNALARIPTLQRNSGRLAPRDNLIRAAASAVYDKTQSGGDGGERFLRSCYPDDEVSPLVLRAATTGATLTGSGWADALASSAVADFLVNLGPVSAGSQLFRAAMQLPLDQGASVVVPGMLASATNTGFVGEAQPIPVRRPTISGVTLSPKKIAAISVFSWETARTLTLEPIVRQSLIESAALVLDGVLFDAAAASATRPAGLLNGVSGISPTAGGGDDAMTADLAALASAVAPVAGGSIAFVAAPGEAVKIALRSRSVPYPVLPSAALASGVVMAVATTALVVAVEPVPEIEASRSTTLHMDDSPAQISTVGSPNVVAAPVQSTFQSAQIALRLMMGVSWGLRAPGAVAWTQSVTW